LSYCSFSYIRFLCTALASTAIYTLSLHDALPILSAVQWQDFKMILPYTIVGVLLVMFLPNKLNILMLGDEVATGLGLNIERTRRSEEHTSELQSRFDLVCRLLLEKKKKLEA